MHMATNDIKVPRRKGTIWLASALANTPRDGKWHLLRTMGVSSAEQAARAMNLPVPTTDNWEFGYRIATSSDGPVSELWARWS
jgi:hypothetical protein